ncbi:hypothetical protein CKAH01_03932 [Colletotrichum kahawae]|uniref:Uncharacterized protein n=1 Tax=Colletotrichum kahawae TaxID=34407 RepID=A0AAD9YQY9_COLKA|nr:hypothetical protein CKAH01_03932 [Colletotrichum kahawae]
MGSRTCCSLRCPTRKMESRGPDERHPPRRLGHHGSAGAASARPGDLIETTSARRSTATSGFWNLNRRYSKARHLLLMLPLPPLLWCSSACPQAWCSHPIILVVLRAAAGMRERKYRWRRKC